MIELSALLALLETYAAELLLGLALVQAVLLILLLVLKGRLKAREKRRKELILDSEAELQKLHQELVTLQKSLPEMIAVKIEESFDSLPGIADRIGDNGEKMLKRLIDWQEEAVRGEQENFATLIHEESEKSLTSFQKQLDELFEQIEAKLDSSISAITSKAQADLEMQNRQLLEKLESEKTNRIQELVESISSRADEIASESLKESIDAEKQHKIVLGLIQKAWESGSLQELK